MTETAFFKAEENMLAGAAVRLASKSSVRLSRFDQIEDVKWTIGLALHDAKQGETLEIAWLPNALDNYRLYVLTHPEG